MLILFNLGFLVEQKEFSDEGLDINEDGSPLCELLFEWDLQICLRNDFDGLEEIAEGELDLFSHGSVLKME